MLQIYVLFINKDPSINFKDLGIRKISIGIKAIPISDIVFGPEFYGMIGEKPLFFLIEKKLFCKQCVICWSGQNDVAPQVD